ncbi:MAG: shikimate kinase [Rhizobiales bacterium]|nr:shikimate kinase [Hyphomicrobiales bacterium]
MKKCIDPNDAYRIRTALAGRNIVFVGMMGSGKSAIGKRLAANLELPFADADSAIEVAAGMSISDIFESFGERHFREGERKVIARLLGEGPMVLSSGGGAFMDADTRALIAERGTSIWLKADIETLLERVRRKDNRPLLKNGDPETIMLDLLKAREPTYALADIIVESRNQSHETVVEAVAMKLIEHFEGARVA